ncbi:hypothetical protein VSR69_41020 [Paraburkholderia phytofirmans]
MAHDLGDPYFLDIVSGMNRGLEHADMYLIIASASNADELRTYERMTEERRVDGMVVARTKLNDPRLRYLAKMHIPFRRVWPQHPPWPLARDGVCHPDDNATLLGSPRDGRK